MVYLPKGIAHEKYEHLTRKKYNNSIKCLEMNSLWQLILENIDAAVELIYTYHILQKNIAIIAR